jgi:glucose/arabinose dehydrogenase
MNSLEREPFRAGRVLRIAGLTLTLAALGYTSAVPQTPDPSMADDESFAFDNRRITCDPDNGGLTLPPGFCALVVAENIGRARHLVVRRNGDIYVAINPARDGSDPGRLLALRDGNRDGRADVIVPIANVGGNGVALDPTQLFLYFAANDRIVRYFLLPGRLQPFGMPATVVSGLPATGDHVSKTVVLNGLGAMFVNIGSATNSCQVENRVPFSPGVDPCPELAVRAGVWAFNAFRNNQTQADGIRFATGLRNMVALALQPRTGTLWGVQNGRDQLFENWPDRYTEEDDREAPAEEVLRISRGMDNGWPYCYEDPRIGTGGNKVLAPEYGGDGQVEGRCADVPESRLEFPAHWAPLSMLFYRAAQFPDRFRGDAFVAFHGARFPGPAEGPGYNVSRIHFENGRPVSREIFADGFAGGTPDPMGARDRPVGLAVGPDGSLYVTSDQIRNGQGGRIWRILFRGTH